MKVSPPQVRGNRIEVVRGRQVVRDKYACRGRVLSALRFRRGVE